MKRLCCVLLALSMALVSDGGLVASGDRAVSGAGGGAPDRRGAAAAGHAKPLPPFVEKHRKERIAAADLVARGLVAPDANGRVTLRNGRFVNYKLQGTEYLTAVLIDFTDVQHGQIPAPDRSIDNSTYWSADVSPAHYDDMLFTPGGGSYGLPSMHDYYLEQSSGQFTWTGQVSYWVQVNASAADFGGNLPKTGAGGDDANGPVYRVVDAALKALAASGNYGGLDLAKADQIDRYDCDGDGIFAEPDGYIDHFGLDFEYENGTHALSMCRQQAGTPGLVAEFAAGSKGSCETQDGVRYEIKGPNAWKWSGEYTNPYQQEHTDLIASIRGGTPLNELRRVAESTLTAIAGREAAYTGKVVVLDQFLTAPFSLMPQTLEFGPIPVPPVAIPGTAGTM